MTATTDIDGLIARLESATGPVRDLDYEVYAASGIARRDDTQDYWRWETPEGARHSDQSVPNYTTDLNAAVSLVPKGWEWTVKGDYHPKRFYARVSNVGLTHEPHFIADRYPTTAAIVLCICALKARGA